VEGALALSETGSREFPDEPAFGTLLEKSRAEQRRKSLELVIANVRAAIAAGNLETARNLLAPAQKHFQNESVLAQLERELTLEQSRHDQLANAMAMLQRGRIDAAERICRDMLAQCPSDPDAIAMLEQVSIKRADRERVQVAKESRRAQLLPIWKRWGFTTLGVLVVAAAVLIFTFRNRQVVTELKPPVPSGPAVEAKRQPPKPAPNPLIEPKKKAAVPTVSKEGKTTKPVQSDPPVAHEQPPAEVHEQPAQPQPKPDVDDSPKQPPPKPTENPQLASPPAKPEVEKFSLVDYYGPHSGTIEWSGPPGRQTVTISGGKASLGRIKPSLPNFPVKITAPQGVRIIESPSEQDWTHLVFETDGTSVRLTFGWRIYQP
jgi:hypothetical protein